MHLEGICLNNIDSQANLIIKDVQSSMPLELLSESVIQAEFYRQCCAIGLPCTLELVTPAGRLDAAVFNKSWTMIIAVVEVKNGHRFSYRQIARYKTIGVPVFGLCNIQRAASLAAQIKRQYLDDDNRSLSLSVAYTDVMLKPRIMRGMARRRRLTIEPDEDLNIKP